jgi:hypothetical protein
MAIFTAMNPDPNQAPYVVPYLTQTKNERLKDFFYINVS